MCMYRHFSKKNLYLQKVGKARVDDKLYVTQKLWGGKTVHGDQLQPLHLLEI